MIYEASHAHDEWATLDPIEIDYAIARAREKYRQDGQSDRNGWDGWDRISNGVRQGWRNQALGALAEQAIARHLDVYPHHTSNGSFHLEPDLPHLIEVKLIGRDHYGLRIYERVPDHFRIVGIVIEQGTERRPPWRIPGWITAVDGKRECWSMAPHGRPPFYAVPQCELLPLATLRLEIAADLIEAGEKFYGAENAKNSTGLKTH